MVLEAIISRDLLVSLLEAARRKFPMEFFSLLGGEVEGENVYITEVIYVPWKEGYHHAIFDLNQIPPGVVGSFHSHPSVAKPSSADIRSFPYLGYVHLIASYPFGIENVRAFDTGGREVRIRIIEGKGQRASF